MSLFNSPSQRQITIGLTILRVVLGTVFIMHGGQKLFVYGLDGVVGSFTKMGVPLPGLIGPAVSMIEFFGGIAIVLGLLTRLAAFGVGATMIGAILTVHLPAGFFAPAGYEFNLSLLAAAATLVLTGAGAFSVDAILGRRLSTGRSAARAGASATRRAA
jgi:putative oxidoreductase